MNWRQGCLLVVACLVICYTIWFLLPSSRYETESQQILANVTQARAELQRRAKDPQQNGYLDPEFLPLWEARRVDPANAALALSSGKENEPPCQIRSLLEAMSPLCDLSQGKKTELQALVSQNKADQLRSIREFEAFYPKIQAVEISPSSWCQTTSRLATAVPTGVTLISKTWPLVARPDRLPNLVQAGRPSSANLPGLAEVLASLGM